MISTAFNAPGQVSPLVTAANQDPAFGLSYATQVLETDGLVDTLSMTEAPRLTQPNGGQPISHVVLQAQVEDAARVVAAADPASVPLIDRVRASTAVLAQPTEERIPSSWVTGIGVLGGILGVVLGILPAFGFLISPWLVLGVLAISLLPYALQWFNSSGTSSDRQRKVAEHEEGILALLRRADELRTLMAQQARQTARVALEPPAMATQ